MSVQPFITTFVLSTLLFTPVVAQAGDIDIRTNNAKVSIDSDRSPYSDRDIYINTGRSTINCVEYRRRYGYYPRNPKLCAVPHSGRIVCPPRGNVYSRSSTYTNSSGSYSRSTSYSSVCRY
jgi:hypothetical protein